MTIVEGETRAIVIDPLISAERAAAGIALYREHRGDQPVVGVIYTHSHGDHFGGVKGVLPDGAGDVPILAGAGFMEEAVAENVYAGTVMNRRAAYMYGSSLDRSPTGQVSTGLGIAISAGALGLIPPNVDITQTGQQENIDGIRIVFQLTPGTETPAEMNFQFPDHRALCVAENATHNLHNLLTLRGALVRDPRTWSHYLNEAIELFATNTDVAFASHHWPPGDGTTSCGSCPSNATCTRTCTTRRCE
jgi:alkyl sulfatase BDS1-like metallo-beta-lactamase superfamily hydrolase